MMFVPAAVDAPKTPYSRDRPVGIWGMGLDFPPAGFDCVRD
jgi:hypothetical protein